MEAIKSKGAFKSVIYLLEWRDLQIFRFLVAFLLLISAEINTIHQLGLFLLPADNKKWIWVLYSIIWISLWIEKDIKAKKAL